MKILVTGSAGHLGEALMRSLRGSEHAAIGLDQRASSFTQQVGSVADRSFVARCMKGVDAVLHTATLHKPHLATHSRQDFVDTNISGTLNLLEAALDAGVGAFVFSSTTSTFGAALTPPPGAPAAWVTEHVVPVPKNIYGVTKVAAENLCELFQRQRGLPCIVLRTSRFFPEGDDLKDVRDGYGDANAKVNEFLHRRVDVEDVVDAHLLAIQRAADIGFDRFIISSTSPFSRDDLAALRLDAPSVVARLVPQYADEYARRGWRMFPSVDRVYVNHKACAELGWRPRHDFAAVIERLRAGGDHLGPLARAIGRKGYHATQFVDEPYPVECD